MPTEKVILSVLRRGIFLDILEISKCFGVERVKRSISAARLGSNAASIERMMANIELGFSKSSL